MSSQGRLFTAKISDFTSGPKAYCGSESPGPVPPAGAAELPLGFHVSYRRIRQLWSSCCSPPRACSSVLGCNNSTRAPWRPVSAPSPWWVSNCARLSQCRLQPRNCHLIPEPECLSGWSVLPGVCPTSCSHFLLLTASDQAGGGAGFPACPTGAWSALTPSPLVCLPLPCSAPALPSLAAKSRAILLPMDLDAHMSALLSSAGSCSAAVQRSAANYKTATRTFPRVIPTANQWDYKNIIEKLQVGVAAQPPGKAAPRWWWGWWWGVRSELLPSVRHCSVLSGWDMVAPWSSWARW